MNKSLQFITTKITFNDCIDLRSRILRPDQPIKNCHYAGDDLASTFHLGILKGTQVLSNGTFILEATPKLPEAKLSYRLRGMATDYNYQKQGLGKLILEAALLELKKLHCDLLWFNARLSAERFYKKMQFEALEEIFEIPSVGPHKVMYKWLG